MNYVITINTTDYDDIPRVVRIERSEEKALLPWESGTEWGYEIEVPDSIAQALLGVASNLDTLP